MTSVDFNFAEPIASYNDSVDANMDVIPADIGSIKKSDFVVLNGRPLKVVEVTHSHPGKHGHSKVFFPHLFLFLVLINYFDFSRFIWLVSISSQVVVWKMFVHVDISFKCPILGKRITQ